MGMKTIWDELAKKGNIWDWNYTNLWGLSVLWLWWSKHECLVDFFKTHFTNVPTSHACSNPLIYPVGTWTVPPWYSNLRNPQESSPSSRPKIKTKTNKTMSETDQHKQFYVDLDGSRIATLENNWTGTDWNSVGKTRSKPTTWVWPEWRQPKSSISSYTRVNMQ